MINVLCPSYPAVTLVDICDEIMQIRYFRNLSSNIYYDVSIKLKIKIDKTSLGASATVTGDVDYFTHYGFRHIRMINSLGLRGMRATDMGMGG